MRIVRRRAMAASIALATALACSPPLMGSPADLEDDIRKLEWIGTHPVANRNALVAAVLALGALVTHDRWRRSGWATGGWLAPLLLGLGLLAFAAPVGLGEKIEVRSQPIRLGVDQLLLHLVAHVGFDRLEEQRFGIQGAQLIRGIIGQEEVIVRQERLVRVVEREPFQLQARLVVCLAERFGLQRGGQDAVAVAPGGQIPHHRVERAAGRNQQLPPLLDIHDSM